MKQIIVQSVGVVKLKSKIKAFPLAAFSGQDVIEVNPQ